MSSAASAKIKVNLGWCTLHLISVSAGFNIDMHHLYVRKKKIICSFIFGVLLRCNILLTLKTTSSSSLETLHSHWTVARLYRLGDTRRSSSLEGTRTKWAEGFMHWHSLQWAGSQLNRQPHSSGWLIPSSLEMKCQGVSEYHSLLTGITRCRRWDLRFTQQNRAGWMASTIRVRTQHRVVFRKPLQSRLMLQSLKSISIWKKDTGKTANVHISLWTDADLFIWISWASP